MLWATGEGDMEEGSHSILTACLGGPQLSNGENLLGGGREAVADRASPPYGEQQVCLAGPA